MSFGERVAGASAGVFVLSLFLTWLRDLDAWQLFRFADLLLALLALGVIAVATASALQFGRISSVARPVLGGAGLGIFLVTLCFLVEGTERGVGIWLGTLAG